MPTVPNKVNIRHLVRILRLQAPKLRSSIFLHVAPLLTHHHAVRVAKIRQLIRVGAVPKPGFLHGKSVTAAAPSPALLPPPLLVSKNGAKIATVVNPRKLTGARTAA